MDEVALKHEEKIIKTQSEVYKQWNAKCEANLEAQKLNFKKRLVKFIYSEKATKILRNLHLTFDHSTHSQKLGEDFTKFCDLLRIYEL